MAKRWVPKPGNLFTVYASELKWQSIWEIVDGPTPGRCRRIWGRPAWGGAAETGDIGGNEDSKAYVLIEDEELQALARLCPEAAARRLGWT